MEALIVLPLAVIGSFLIGNSIVAPVFNKNLEGFICFILGVFCWWIVSVFV